MFEAMAPHMKFPMGFVFSHLGMFERLLIKLIPKLNAADARQFTGLSDTVIRFAPHRHRQAAIRIGAWGEREYQRG